MSEVLIGCDKDIELFLGSSQQLAIPHSRPSHLLNR
jgi:hypothetical protein